MFRFRNDDFHVPRAPNANFTLGRGLRGDIDIVQLNPVPVDADYTT